MSATDCGDLSRLYVISLFGDKSNTRRILTFEQDTGKGARQEALRTTRPQYIFWASTELDIQRTVHRDIFL